jgi:hypothetical protein
MIGAAVNVTRTTPEKSTPVDVVLYWFVSAPKFAVAE